MNETPLHTLLSAHADRYPNWQPQDVYKLAHQAALGSEHAVVDRESARAWLQRELTQLAGAQIGAPAEPLIDPISADGALARVHLRSLLQLHLPAAPLLDAFITTAHTFRGSLVALEDSLAAAISLAGSGRLGVDAAELAALIARMRAVGFPAAHHSAAYTRAYHPAYRVAAVDHLPAEYRACQSANPNKER